MPQYTGDANPNNLLGSATADNMLGNQGNDTLSGLDGDDTIFGGRDQDLIYGGNNNDSLSGDLGEDTIYGDAGDDYVYGGDGNDNLNGGTGNDHLYGGTGADFLNGNEGYDDLHGEDGNDTLRGGQQNDTLDGGNDNDVAFGDLGDDSILGMMGTDELHGDDGNDTIHGGQQNDTLYGGTGNDSLNGDNDNDLLNGDAGDDVLNGGLGNDSLYGGDGNDQINGGDGDDYLQGNTGLDTLDGGTGNDLIFGGQDSDKIYGGDGNDTIYGDLGNDTISGNAGADVFILAKEANSTDTILDFDVSLEKLDLVNFTDIHQFSQLQISQEGTSTKISLGNNQFLYLANVTSSQLSAGNFLAGAGHSELDGTSGNDSITGTNQNDTVYGGGGNDTINAGDGNDAVYGGDGADILNGGAGADFLQGNGGDDTIDGATGDDTIRGGQQNDSLMGGDDNDFVYGDKGNDKADGQAGNDSVFGGDGNDTLNGGIGNDLLSGNEGTDFLSGDSGNDALYGGKGDDNLSGGDNDDIVSGDVGNDTLDGGTGNDTILSGVGSDVVTGGTGTDNFVIAKTANATTTINDFDKTSEKINLTAFDNINNFNQLSINYANNAATISLTDGQSVKVNNVAAGQLTANNFDVNVELKIYTVSAALNAKNTITDFNPNDARSVIDLADFGNYKKFSDLGAITYSNGDAILNLANNQTLTIKNIAPNALTGANFMDYNGNLLTGTNGNGASWSAWSDLAQPKGVHYEFSREFTDNINITASKVATVKDQGFRIDPATGKMIAEGTLTAGTTGIKYLGTLIDANESYAGFAKHTINGHMTAIDLGYTYFSNLGEAQTYLRSQGIDPSTSSADTNFATFQTAVIGGVPILAEAGMTALGVSEGLAFGVATGLGVWLGWTFSGDVEGKMNAGEYLRETGLAGWKQVTKDVFTDESYFFGKITTAASNFSMDDFLGMNKDSRTNLVNQAQGAHIPTEPGGFFNLTDNTTLTQFLPVINSWTLPSGAFDYQGFYNMHGFDFRSLFDPTLTWGLPGSGVEGGHTFYDGPGTFINTNILSPDFGSFQVPNWMLNTTPTQLFDYVPSNDFGGIPVYDNGNFNYDIYNQFADGVLGNSSNILVIPNSFDITSFGSYYLNGGEIADNALVNGTHRNVFSGQSIDVTFSFNADKSMTNGDASVNQATITSLDAAQKAAVLQILNQIGALANIRFMEEGTPGAGTVSLVFAKGDVTSAAGEPAGVAINLQQANFTGNTVLSSTVVIDKDAAGTAPGTEGYYTLMHEIGHALGLGDVFAEDGAGSTVMANVTGNYANSLLYYDILAYQYLYGANTTFNSGNTTYTLSNPALPGVLWDGGGNDTLTAAGTTGNAVLDLREGFDYVSSAGAVTTRIMKNAGIENAVGAAGNDTIYGNDLNNTLTGGAGNDVFFIGKNAGKDLITDFNPTQDKLNLSLNGADLAYYLAHLSQNASGWAVLSDVADPALATWSVTLQGVNKTSLNATNIITNEVQGTTDNDYVDGKEFGEHVLGGDGNDKLKGNGGNDTLEGGLGDDSLWGGAGDDVLKDTGGSNYFDGGDGNNTMTGGTGDDRMYGGTGNDRIDGDWGNDLIDAGDGNDSLYGGFNDDQLFGGGGDDFLMGGKGAGDTLNGGIGNDTASYANADGAVTINLSTGLTSGYEASSDVLISIENLEGSQFDDNFIGDNNANVLNGLGGFDTLTGLGGDDTLIGGEGSGYLDGGDGNDTASFANVTSGPLYTNLASFFSYIHLATQDVYTQTPNVENIIGTNQNDTISGNEGANSLQGLSGNDSILGYGGNDVITGDDGVDTLRGGDGNDFIQGGAGDDKLYGNNDTDTIDGGEGNDYIEGDAGVGILHGGSGNDTVFGDALGDRIYGDEGDDQLVSYAGNDTVLGGYGNDKSWVGEGNDYADGGLGNDSMYGDKGNDTLNGGDGNDYFLADADDDLVNGGSDNDTIFGGDGNDVLNGDDGVDKLNGGLGNDTLDGGIGTDTADYSSSTTAVNVNLATGIATGQGTDTLSNIENVAGSAYNDVLTGDAKDNLFEGSTGADTINGGAGNDTVSYTASTAAVNIDLTAGTGSGGSHAAGDVLVSIENVNATAYADTVTGNDGNNVINGAAGNDFIYAKGGDDVVNAGDGNDNVTGLTGNDLLNGEAGTDTLQGGDGNDTLDGGADNDVLNGNIGDDLLLGSGGNDTINGNEGNDTLEGGDGADSLDGSIGVNTVSYASSTAGVSVDLTASTASGGHATGDKIVNFQSAVGSAYNDTITGNDGVNNIQGGAGNDFIYAKAGNDTVDGGDGNDNVTGLTGADQLTGGAGNDTLQGGDDNDTLDGGADNDVLNGDNGNDIIYGGAGNDALSGGIGNDTLEGGAGADSLDGGAGSNLASYASSSGGVSVNLLTNVNDGGHATGDTLNLMQNVTGSSYNDTITGSDSSNIIDGGSGNDVLFGRSSGDTLTGGAGDDTLDGGIGSDSLDGGAGNDTASYAASAAGVTVDLTAGTGASGEAAGDKLTSIENLIGSSMNDTLTGTDIANLISAGAGNDTIYAKSGNDTVFGGDGNDVMTGLTGADKLYGENGNDTLQGGDDNDFLFGGAGNDVLNGDNGDDILNGGLGVDTMNGGAGADVFTYSAKADSTDTQLDLIAGFTRGTDKIDLTGLGFTGISAGAGSGTILGYSTVGSDTVIVDATTDFAIKLGGGFSTLTASDFIFG